jgi:hypothetical protein
MSVYCCCACRCMSNASGMASNTSGGDLSMLRSCSQASLDTMS